MLIELYCRDNTGASTTATLLQNAASVPPSTARRWIRHLKEMGLVRINLHPTDRQTSFVEMTQTAKETLERYLTRVRAAATQQSRSGFET